MHIESFKNLSFNTNAALETIKEYAIWGGHQISKGFTNYIIPAIQALWSYACTAFNTLKNNYQAAPATTFALASALFLGGIAAFKLADRKSCEDSIITRRAYEILGITAWTGAVAATIVGIAAIGTV